MVSSMPRQTPAARRRSRLAGRGVAVVMLGSACVAACSRSSCGAELDTFVGGAALRQSRWTQSSLRAESGSAASSSTALIKVTPENTVTAASVVGGLAGLLLGGFWIGATTFAAASYFSRRDDDIAGVLKTVGSKSLEFLNYGASMNEKYTVTDTVGTTVSGALDNAKKDMSGDTKKAVDSLGGIADGISGAVKSADDEFNLKDSLGSVVTSASSMANQAVTKVVETATEYKVTEQISKKIDEVTKK